MSPHVRTRLVSALTLAAASGAASPALGSWPFGSPYMVERTGLYGAAQTGSAGLQSSSVVFFAAPDHLAGYSARYSGVSTDNGQNTWAWDRGTTNQIGLFGPANTGSAGYQYSTLVFQNAAGQAAGSSTRYTGVNTYNGRDTWIWNGSATIQVGLTGAGYTGTGGNQISEIRLQNNFGQVAGYSVRVYDVNFSNGGDAWVWNGTTTTAIGLTGPGYTGSAGFQVSSPLTQNDNGQVTGYSRRYTGVDTYLGQDVWIWSGGTIQQIGLVGGTYLSIGGRQFSETKLHNNAGKVAGVSTRYTGMSETNGRDAWVWNGVETFQIGLTGPGYTGGNGYQSSEVWRLNGAGQIIGNTYRVSGVNSDNGRDTWVSNGTSTVQIGLTGGIYTGSAGYQYSGAGLQNEAGQVVGSSVRVTGLNTYNGRDAWVWNGTTTTQIGLTGGVFTDPNGRQFSESLFLNAAGQVAGRSERHGGVSIHAGYASWVWDGTITRQVGLSGVEFLGVAGYINNTPSFQNSAGQVVGTTERFGGSGQNGLAAWYYDPTTLVTLPVYGSIRSGDYYSLTVPTLLTEGGFMLGYYMFFPGGMNPGVEHAFIFKPEYGLTDLGVLINGGLTLNGWSTLLRPQFSDALATIVGHGYVNGQTTGQSVFVMSVPAPGSFGLLGLGGAVALRRNRRPAVHFPHCH